MCMRPCEGRACPRTGSLVDRIEDEKVNAIMCMRPARDMRARATDRVLD